MAVQAGHYTDPLTGAVAPPIHTSTTFARDDDYETIYSAAYSRDGNPTYDQLETVLAVPAHAYLAPVWPQSRPFYKQCPPMRILRRHGSCTTEPRSGFEGL